MTKLIPNTTPLREFKGHEKRVTAVAVFPDRRRIVTASCDQTLCLWDLKTGVVLKKMEGHRSGVYALAVSRDGQIIASGDVSGEVIAWNGETGEPVTQPMKVHSNQITSLDFSAAGTVLATGSFDDTVKLWCTKTWQQQGNPNAAKNFVKRVQYSPSGELLAIATIGNIQIYNSGTREHVATLKTFNSELAWAPDGTRLLSAYDAIEEWDTSTWEKVGDTWKGHTKIITAIAVNPAGTLVASASYDNHVRLWRLSDRQTIAIFTHSSAPTCLTFSMDGNSILSGGNDNQISEWEVRKGLHSNILTAFNTTARYSCLTGDLSTAEQLLTQKIDAKSNGYTSYANRSFVMARKQDWDRALDDAIKSISIQPSLIGYISKGIALCGRGNVRDARIAFDVASMFTNQDSEINHFLLLIKAIALFNADRHDEAMLLIKELAAACPNADTLACRVVEAYLHVQLGTKAFDAARHDEAADHFASAVNSSAFPSKIIHEIYEDFIVLFGWELETFWLTTHQKCCQTFLSAGKVEEALESHQHMMDAIDETERSSCLDWSNDFKEQCRALTARDDRILGAEIPGQDQDGYDAEPDFFRGMHGQSRISRPRPQQRPGRFKKLRLAVTRRPLPPPAAAPTPTPPTALPPAAAPIPASPTALPPATAPMTFTAHVRHLFTWRPDHAAPPVVEVPFAQGRKRNAAAGAPADDDSDIIRAEYDEDDPQDPNTQQPNAQQPNTQQQQPAAMQADAGGHGGGKSCFCC